MKIETRVLHVVDYSDFEKTVREELGIKDYSFLAEEECPNDSDHEFRGISEELDEYSAQGVVDTLRGENYGYSAYELLYALCNMGHIPSGDYLIKVCW